MVTEVSDMTGTATVVTTPPAAVQPKENPHDGLILLTVLVTLALIGWLERPHH
jgi:hypothetical protein